jgi:hypothetical protein
VVGAHDITDGRRGLVVAARTARRHPSGVLLAVQMLQLLLEPFLDSSRAGKAGLAVVGTLVVGVALWAVRRTPALSLVAFTLGVPAIVFSVLEAASPGTDWIVLTSALLHAPFYLYVSYSQIRYLFHDDEVSPDELYAVGAAFTVVAWAFTYLYVAVQIVWPGSFTGGGGAPYGWFELLFFSFSNLTSCGLSDVLPALDHARSLVIIEQVAGVMYVALVVARMVGLTVQRARR